MVTRTFLDKCTTIFRGSKDNFGLNPICMLNYGFTNSRFLVHFNTDKIEKLTEDGTYGDRSAVTHHLKMTNCGSIDPKKFDKRLPSWEAVDFRKRATSFTLIAFEVPRTWDAGVGFDNSFDFWLTGKQSVSRDGCNWYQPKNGLKWAEEGIYNDDFLQVEYEHFCQGGESVIVAKQDFDYGNEDLDLDLTQYVNDILDGKKKNNGLCIMFVPYLDEIQREGTDYVGFFGNTTRTFFEPVVETRSSAVIADDRYTFYKGRTNRLYYYVYSSLTNSFDNLDELPICTIEGVEYPVKHASRGIYYAEVKLPNGTARDNQILSDVWSNLKYQGEEMDDVELDFVVRPSSEFISQGEAIETTRLSPIIYGINDSEKVVQGDTRYLYVDFCVPYESTDNYRLINTAWYRLYVKDGDKDVDVIDWDNINKQGKRNSFRLDTGELVPNRYFIDIKAKIGNEILIFKEKLEFMVVNNETEKNK